MPAERTDEEIAREIAFLLNLSHREASPGEDVWVADGDAVKVIASVLRTARAQGEAAGIERAAQWHDEQAEACRRVAQTTREEWCGPDIPAEDRRANYADAREHDTLAGIHERHARGVRSLSPAPKDEEV